jgi:hypothetical protein
MMDKSSVLNLFEIMACNYPLFDISDEKLEVWNELLADQDFEKVKRNVLRHIKTEKYPPTIAEIIDHSPKQETSFIDQLAEMRRNAASPEVAAMHKARIRELLNG